ncbi:MAG TPA: hypothetical protein PKH01_06365, partial [Pseudomonadales bacterium]|nr:hypothetical protein [Pseudomonadales bacterium]
LDGQNIRHQIQGKIRNTFGIKQHPWRAGLTSSVRRALVVLNAEDGAIAAKLEKEENEERD